MKYVVLFCLTFLLSCGNDDNLLVEDETIIIPTKEEEECVTEEYITSQDTVLIFDAGEMVNGFADAIKLNQDWMASGSASFLTSGQLALTFQTNLEGDLEYIVEMLFFTLDDYNIGCYELLKESGASTANYLSLDYDVVKNSYEIADEENNFLEIIKIDTIQNFVQGKFAVSFDRDTLRTPPWYNPEKVRFFNGAFELDIIE